MDFIRNWVLTISLCSIGSALIYFLVPKAGLEKPMRTVISIFLLAAVISPLFKVQGLNLSELEWDKELLSQQSSEQAEKIQEVAEKQFCQLVLNSLHKALESEGFIEIDIELITETNEQGQISISEIKVPSKIESHEDKTKISQIIMQETGLEAIFEKAVRLKEN